MSILTRGLLNSTALTNAGLISAGLMLVSGPAMALGQNTLPQNGQVIGGQATIVQSAPNTLTIDQTSNNAAINWKSFSIGSNATTNFVQPGAGSIAVNRVTGVDPSQIAGHLNANGQVVLVNPNGILFTKSAQVNVGGLVASTSGISEKNAIAGKLVFDQGSSAGAKIVNEGQISARDGGLVALVAPSVVNNGVITARLGKVSLAAGDKWTLDLYGDKLVNFALDSKVAGEVSNSGEISASGGEVQITANVAKDVVNSAINMGGIVEASSVSQQGGTIVLDGGDGKVSVTGKLVADGTTGGTVKVTGADVTLKGATIKADGTDAGGTIDIGGEAHGAGTLAHAQTVTVDASSTLSADSKAGKGGSVTVWSDGETKFAGKASTKGAVKGGTVESSGHTLSIDGAQVDVSANSGNNGTWLLDPYNLTIDANGAAAIETGLKSGNVVVQTTANGASGQGSVTLGTGDINVDSDIVWGGANNGGSSSLTLSAYDSINVNANVLDTGSGNIVLRADNAASGGNVAGSVSIGVADRVSTEGTVSIYYRPTDYAAPSVYTAQQADGQLGTTAYMLVDNVADLNNVQNNLGGTYALGTNIAGVGNIAPIGNGVTPFTGLFDGNGGLGANYTIDGVTAAQSGAFFEGLFGANTGTIRNVTLTNAVAEGFAAVGALVGYNSGSLINDGASNVHVTSDGFSQDIGGLIGYNDVTGFVSGGSVSGGVYVGGNTTNGGGFVGLNAGTILGGTFDGTVIAGCVNIGGFVGYNTDTGYISGASAAAYVENGLGGSAIGGFAGLNAGYLLNDTATQVFTGSSPYNNSAIGGFVGQNTTSGSIVGGYVQGTVTAASGNLDIGGFVGRNEGSITSSTSDVILVVGDNVTDIGGFAGYNSGAISNNNFTFHAITAGTGVSNVGGYIGKNAAGTISGVTINGGYVSGSGNNIGGLLGYNSGTLSHDDYNGTVNGGGKSVGGAVGQNFGTIDDVNVTGLITISDGTGYTGGVIGANYGGVSNSSFNGTIAAGCYDVGGFVGANFGTISNSYAQATISNGWYEGTIGGFAGENAIDTVNGTVYTGLLNNIAAINTYINVGFYNYDIGGVVGFNSATIVGAVGTGTVYAQVQNTAVGGFVGYNTGVISAAAATDDVHALSFSDGVGGFAGYNTGTIVAAAATGSVLGDTFMQNVGGFIGNNSGVVASDQLSSAMLNGLFSSIFSGYSGQTPGTVPSGSVSSVTVDSGSLNVGGFIGFNQNATVSGISISAPVSAGSASSNVGGFVGNNQNGTLTNDQVTGGGVSVGSGGGFVGGFAGSNSGSLANDSFAGNVQVGDGSYFIGGGVGINNPTGSISGLTVNGNVIVGSNVAVVGGLVGGNSDATLSVQVQNHLVTIDETPFTGAQLSNSSFFGTILGGSSDVMVAAGVGNNTGTVSGISVSGEVSVGGGNSGLIGGAIGFNNNIVSNSSFDGDVFAASQAVGGFAGINSGTISGSSFNGNVNNNASLDFVGGFAGVNAEFIAAPFNPAATLLNDKVSGNVTAGSGAYGIGGLAGYSDGLVSAASFSGNVIAGDGARYVAGGVGMNDAGGTVSGITVSGSVVAGNNVTAVGGLVGLNGSDPSNGFGNFASQTASLSNSIFSGTVTVGTSSFAVGGLAGWNSLWNAASGGTVVGTVDYTTLGGAGQVLSPANGGTTFIHNANQVGCEEGAGGNCFGTAGQEVITVTPNNLTSTYGQSAQSATYSLSYTVPGETGTVNGLESFDKQGDVLVVNLQNNQTNAGSSAITGSATINPNNANALLDYTVVLANTGISTVNKANVTVTATGSQTYGGTNINVSYSYNGLVNGDSSGVITGLGYVTPGITASTNAGTYQNGITATGGTASNYTVVDASGTYTVNKANVTVAATGSQTYGGTNVQVSYGYTGLVNGDSSGVITGLGYVTPGITASTNAGTYQNGITATGGTASNYTVVDASGTYTVNKANVTVAASGSQTYGGTNVQVSYGYTGLVNGDSSGAITGLGYVTPGITASTNAGTYQNGITATGGTASNYTVVDASGTYTVNKANVTVAATGSQTYGGTNVQVSYGYTGLVNGDSSGAITGLGYVTPGITASTNAGTYQNGITATGGTASNYTVVDASGTYTVNKANVTVAASGSQTYGGTNVQVSYGYTGLVNGDSSGAITGLGYVTPGITASTNAGTYQNGITATGGTASNYTVVDASGTYTVNKAPLTITPTGSQTYGGTNTTVSYGYNGLVNGDTAGSITGVGYNTNATPSSNAGTYSVTATDQGAMNYTITDGTGTFTVNKAALTITANDTTRTQGTNNPAFTASFQGLVNGDGSSVVTGLAFTPGDTSGLGPMVYTNIIGVSSGMAQNYTLTYAPGTLTVVAAPVTPVTPVVTPTTPATAGNIVALNQSIQGQITGLNSLMQGVTQVAADQNNLINCLKVNSEIRGVTTDSPIDCATPLQVNGF